MWSRSRSRGFYAQREVLKKFPVLILGSPDFWRLDFSHRFCQKCLCPRSRSSLTSDPYTCGALRFNGTLICNDYRKLSPGGPSVQGCCTTCCQESPINLPIEDEHFPFLTLFRKDPPKSIISPIKKKKKVLEKEARQSRKRRSPCEKVPVLQLVTFPLQQPLIKHS